MDKDVVLNLLNNINTTKLVGKVPIDVIESSLKDGLLERNKNGNFELTEKGLEFLNEALSQRRL
ncbi:MAG TPA: hypothetical protein VFE54_00960 [Mucilaginibacter sp.]|nr:hypothetical protein [Mucilaginibacter sp.]